MKTVAPEKRIIARRAAVVGALALLALLAVGGLVLLQPARPPRIEPASEVAEIPRAELHLRDGRLYHHAETNAFTGWMLERYECGALKSRSAISQGLLHGLSEGWHTNGQIQIREHFRSGISHGERLKYYADGSRMSQATVVEGKIEGVFKRWHPNGQLAETAEIRAGVAHGNSQAYFPSGFLKTQAKLQSGKVIETHSWADGEFQISTAGSTAMR
jgi:antitoxin component YwqK of YwqJK toxin-antitoxin module